MKNLLLLGDSIRLGYQSFVKEKLAARIVLDTAEDDRTRQIITNMLGLFEAVQKTVFKMIDWIILLFLVLDALNLTPAQTSTIIALALGINPLLDMFETACNVTGDNIGTFVVGKKFDMIEK